MRATVEMRAANGARRRHPLQAGESLWLGASGERREPDGADLCVVASGGTIWAIIRPGGAAQSRGRPVMAGLIDLLEAPLTLDGAIWTAHPDDHGPRPTTASAASECPVCRLPIAPGDEALACSCGAITDSRFCAAGGAADAGCLACGTPLIGGMSR